MQESLIFEAYFEREKEESSSPFLTASARRWSRNLNLRASYLAAFFLCLSFALSFHPKLTPISQFSLILVYFLAGTHALIESIENISNFEINIDVLMTLAAFSSIFIGSGMEGGLLHGR